VSTLTPQSPSHAEQGPIGLEIPGYRIEALLHQGNTATVYKAVQTALDRPVAIKVLHAGAQSSSGNGEPEPWKQEAVVRARLSHPNIVSVYDAGECGEARYFVMEYVAGHSLRASMQRGKPWRIGLALPVLQAVTEALEYIHARGLLHLDLKPENVLLSETGQPKVTDFGISQLVGQNPADTAVWGTSDYCAPEQRYGLGVDRRADVFSLAALAYELLTGYVPGRVYVPATQRNRLLPAGVDKVLARGLARDKEERYETALAFYQDLSQALLNKRQHPIWGSLAALAIAGAVALPWLVQRQQNSWRNERENSPEVIAAPGDIAGPKDDSSRSLPAKAFLKEDRSVPDHSSPSPEESAP